MSSSSIRKHASTGPANDQPAVPEPSFAERARILMHLGRIGSLSTHSSKQPGFPFGSVMPYGLDEQGHPIFLISTMAMHTQICGRSVKSTVHHLGDQPYENNTAKLVQIAKVVEYNNQGDDWGTVCLIEGCKEVTPGIVHGWRCANHQKTEASRI